MKSKYIAGILAIIIGVFGTHKFYLGKKSAGFFRFGLFAFALVAEVPQIIAILGILAFIEGIILFSMGQKDFDKKYNRDESEGTERRQRYEHRRRREEHHKYRHEKRHEEKKRSSAPARRVSNPHKKAGIENYKDYDYEGAIDEFLKALTLEPDDIATHFNIACAYSLTEKKDKAFRHLDRAVQLGFSDFEKIQDKDAFAYLRVQPEFEKFVNNGYRLRQQPQKEEVEEPSQPPQLEAPKANLLDNDLLLEKLQKLGDLREKGLLTEEEFNEHKKRLLD